MDLILSRLFTVKRGEWDRGVNRDTLGEKLIIGLLVRINAKESVKCCFFLLGSVTLMTSHVVLKLEV